MGGVERRVELQRDAFAARAAQPLPFTGTDNDTAYGAALDLAAPEIDVAIVELRNSISAELQHAAREAGIALHLGCAVARANGGKHVRSVEVCAFDRVHASIGSAKLRLPCDLLLVSGGWTPTLQLLGQRGAKPVYDDKRAMLVAAHIPRGYRVAGSASGELSLRLRVIGGLKEGSAAAEACGFAPSPVQVSGWPESFQRRCRKLETLLACRMPEDGLRAVSQGERSIFRVGPERLWVAGPSDGELLPTLDGAALGEDAVVTEIGHSRTIVRVAGAGARTLLNRGLPIDLDASVFPVDAFAQSVIHHMPVLVHRAGRDGNSDFDVYVARDYAVSFWEWLTGAARSAGCQISEAE